MTWSCVLHHDRDTNLGIQVCIHSITRNYKLTLGVKNKNAAPLLWPVLLKELNNLYKFFRLCFSRVTGMRSSKPWGMEGQFTMDMGLVRLQGSRMVTFPVSLTGTFWDC